MSLVEYARQELAGIEKDDDGMQNEMNRHLLEMVKLFADEGHSGFSANYAISVLERLLRFLPLTALTGEDDEWTDRGEGVSQNKRCSAVFKDKDGNCERIDGKVFSDNGGITWYTNSQSHVPVTFPYYPPAKPEYVYLSEDQERVLTDQSEINALRQKKRAEFDEAQKQM